MRFELQRRLRLSFTASATPTSTALGTSPSAPPCFPSTAPPSRNADFIEPGTPKPTSSDVDSRLAAVVGSTSASSSSSETIALRGRGSAAFNSRGRGSASVGRGSGVSRSRGRGGRGSSSLTASSSAPSRTSRSKNTGVHEPRRRVERFANPYDQVLSRSPTATLIPRRQAFIRHLEQTFPNPGVLAAHIELNKVLLEQLPNGRIVEKQVKEEDRGSIG
ncbi:hypothetical protein BDV98DRAFT_596506 [Pterulicium gracile]|uniref:Uncharacterized protein n=1 Tax=Pterulicium gracile TaxID=1884261 RepID=A0A5C3Q604_9AGAR|nr:hypothetical protein BDV98DRAFT_596506 [Pterula gracilis]